MAGRLHDGVSATPVVTRRLAVVVTALVFLGATAAVARVASRPAMTLVQADASVAAPPSTAAATTTLPTATLAPTTLLPTTLAPVTTVATIPVRAPSTTRPRPTTTIPATTPPTVARVSAPSCSSQMTLLGISPVSLPGVYQSQTVICEGDPAAYYRCRSYMVTTLAIMNSGEGEAAMIASFDRLLACMDS
jgi:hypothetical protein